MNPDGAEGNVQMFTLSHSSWDWVVLPSEKFLEI